MTFLSGPAHHLTEGCNAALAAAEQLDDLHDRESALQNAILVADDLGRRLREARAEVLRDMVALNSATAVAAQLGISRQRLYQLMDRSPSPLARPDTPYSSSPRTPLTE